MLIYSIFISFLTLHGFPKAREFSSISFVTTDPDPITVLFPIFTPGFITTFAPIHTLFPIFIS